MIDAITVETAPKPTAAIIWLHGLGADGHDFEPVVPEVTPRGRSWRFIFPNAPVRPVTINNGMRMRAWYDIKGFDRQAAEDVDGFKASQTLVRELIDGQLAAGIPSSRIVLAGFSQGGAVSLYTLPRLAHKLAGVMALSCYLPVQSSFESERVHDNDATPIFIAHGSSDPVVPMQMGSAARDYLKAQGYAVQWHDYPMPHSVSAAEIKDIREFLTRVLP
jgi:phospholipase/carboxylesterase